MAIIKPGQLSSGLYSISGSFSGSFQGDGSGLTDLPIPIFDTGSFVLTSSFNAFTSSYNTGSFTGSFIGNGSGLTNLPTQSFDNGSFATTGSNIFIGDQIITGSIHQSGTFYPNQIDWFSSSIGYDTGSFILTTTANGLTTYAGYGDVANTLAPYVPTVSSSISASYTLTASNALSASYALNGGVTQLLAGPNVTLSPTNGLGQVTVSATLSGSTIFNTATGSYGSFYDTTTQTNVASTARSMSFNTTDISNGVSISGSTSPFNTYIKTQNAGVYDIQFSAQVDKTDSGTDEIWIWLRKNGSNLNDTATSLQLVGNGAHYVAAWNWFVNSAANDYYQIMWYSPDANVRLHAEAGFGIVPGIPSVILTANRVDQFLSNTGSFSGSFTGTLTGTASYTTQALSASYAPSTPPFPYTGSALITGSLGVTGSVSILAYTASADKVFYIRNSANTYDIISNYGSELTIIGRNESSEPRLLINRAGSTKMLLGGTTDLNITFPSSGKGEINSGAQGLDIIATSGDIRTRNASTYTLLKGNFFGIGQATPAARLDVLAQGALSTDIAFRVRNSADTANLVEQRGNGSLLFSNLTSTYVLNPRTDADGFSLSSGNGLYGTGTGMEVVSNGFLINNSGSRTFRFTGASVTNLWEFRNESGQLRICPTTDTTNPIINLNGTTRFVGVGILTPTARLDVKAQGALSTDIAFRVRNSADTLNPIQITGDGKTKMQGSTYYAEFDPSNGLYVGNNYGNMLNFTGILQGTSYFNNGADGKLALGKTTADYRLDVQNSTTNPLIPIRLGTSNGENDSKVGIAFTTTWTGGTYGNVGGVLYMNHKYIGPNQAVQHCSFDFALNSLNTAPTVKASITAKSNLLLGTPTENISDSHTIYIPTGSTPTSSITDGFKLYSSASVAGNASPHFRTEAGNIIKLYQQTSSISPSTFVTNTSLIANDTATFDGYTIGQIVKALRNLGILA